MPTVAVYSPSLLGHRQTYCRVLAQILLDDGLDVAVVAGVDELQGPQGASVAPQLRELEEHGRYRFVGLPATAIPSLHRDLAGFTRLLDDIAADAVVLTEADRCLALLNARILRRGGSRRWVGLFIRSTNYLHERSLERSSLSDTVLCRARQIKHAPTRWRTEPKLFHETLMPRLHLLDGALYLDEVYVGAHGASALWLPDIFFLRPWREERDSAETRTWAEKLTTFMAEQGRRPVFVYLGAPQLRRGYDTLLQLAVAEDGCFVHCGRNVDGMGDWVGVEPARRELQCRGALLETGAYYESDATVDLFLSFAKTVVLPYREHLGSSGIMLQGLAAGRPVLVPDQGLMADRVRAFGLGRTYRAGDWDDLRREDRALRAEGPGLYAARLEAFMVSFAREQVENAVRRAMGYGSKAAVLPAPPLGDARRGDRP